MKRVIPLIKLNFHFCVYLGKSPPLDFIDSYISPRNLKKAGDSSSKFGKIDQCVTVCKLHNVMKEFRRKASSTKYVMQKFVFELPL